MTYSIFRKWVIAETLALLLFAGRQSIAQASDAPPIVTAVGLRRACLAIWDGKYPGRDENGVIRICEFDGDPRLLLDSVPGVLAELRKLDVIAASLTEDRWRALAKIPHPRETEVLGQQSLGSLAVNESAIIWGVAEFVANRAKTQAQSFALVQYVQRLCAADARMLVPATCKALTGEPGVIELLRTPTVFRAAARRDLAAAPPRAVDLLIERNRERLGPAIDQAIAARMMLQTIASSVQGVSAEEAIANLVASVPRLAYDAKLSVEVHPYATALYLGGLTLASIGAPFATIGEVMPKPELLVTYTARAAISNLALGRPIASPTWKAEPVWKCDAERNPGFTCPFAAAEPLIKTVISEAERLSAIRARLNKATTVSEQRAALVDYGKQLLTLVDLSAEAEAAPSVVAKARRIRGAVRAVAAAYAADDYSRALGEVLLLPDSLGIDIQIPHQAVRAATLIASVADADSASQVAAILDNVVAGSRGYSAKRNAANGPFITLNAYAGALAGWEHIGERGGTAPDKSTFGAAYVPIGLEAGIPFSSDKLKLFRSAALFVQVADLGAPTSWRLSSTANVDQEPEVHFTQIFAPGISLMLGIRQTPLVFGVGVGGSPALRRVREGSVENVRGVRRTPMFSLAMDIPIVP